jgi:hypothetical protein
MTQPAMGLRYFRPLWLDRIARIEIDKSGKIVIIPADPTDQPGETVEANEWDRV